MWRTFGKTLKRLKFHNKSKIRKNAGSFELNLRLNSHSPKFNPLESDLQAREHDESPNH